MTRMTLEDASTLTLMASALRGGSSAVDKVARSRQYARALERLNGEAKEIALVILGIKDIVDLEHANPQAAAFARAIFQGIAKVSAAARAPDAGEKNP